MPAYISFLKWLATAETRYKCSEAAPRVSCTPWHEPPPTSLKKPKKQTKTQPRNHEQRQAQLCPCFCWLQLPSGDQLAVSARLPMEMRTPLPTAIGDFALAVQLSNRSQGGLERRRADPVSLRSREGGDRLMKRYQKTPNCGADDPAVPCTIGIHPPRSDIRSWPAPEFTNCKGKPHLDFNKTKSGFKFNWKIISGKAKVIP